MCRAVKTRASSQYDACFDVCLGRCLSSHLSPAAGRSKPDLHVSVYFGTSNASSVGRSHLWLQIASRVNLPFNSCRQIFKRRFNNGTFAEQNGLWAVWMGSRCCWLVFCSTQGLLGNIDWLAFPKSPFRGIVVLTGSLAGLRQLGK